MDPEPGALPAGFFGRTDGRLLLLGGQCLKVAPVDIHPISGASRGLFDDPARLKLAKQ